MAPVCLFTSPRGCTPLFLSLAGLLIHLLGRCNGTPRISYHAYDVTSDSLCSRDTKREVPVTQSSPVIVEARSKWVGKLTSGESPPLTCTFEVEAKGSRKLGVVSVVQRMAFRSQGDSCVDYIQTVYKERKGHKVKFHRKKDKTRKVVKNAIKKIITGDRHRRASDDADGGDRGPRICGDVLFGLHVDQNQTMPPPFANPLPPVPPLSNVSRIVSLFLSSETDDPYRALVSEASEVDPKGELKTLLHVSNRMLRVGEEIKLRVVYSVYQECDGRRVPAGMFHCGYGLCISDSLVNDGFVNCPFGDCIDETNCTNAKTANITAEVLRYVPKQPSTASWNKTIILVVIGVIVAVGFVCYVVYKVRRKNKNKKENEEADDEGDKVEDANGFNDPSKMAGADPSAAPFYPPAGYAPPPGGQPGYYPMVPQGYGPYPPQQSVAPGYPSGPAPAPGPPQWTAYPPPSYPQGPLGFAGPGEDPNAIYPTTAPPQQQQAAAIPNMGYPHQAPATGGYPPYPMAPNQP